MLIVKSIQCKIHSYHKTTFPFLWGIFEVQSQCIISNSKVNTYYIHTSRKIWQSGCSWCVRFPSLWIGLIHYYTFLIFSIINIKIFENFECMAHVRMTALAIHLLFSELLGGRVPLLPVILCSIRCHPFCPDFFSNFIVFFLSMEESQLSRTGAWFNPLMVTFDMFHLCSVGKSTQSSRSSYVL